MHAGPGRVLERIERLAALSADGGHPGPEGAARDPGRWQRLFDGSPDLVEALRHYYAAEVLNGGLDELAGPLMTSYLERRLRCLERWGGVLQPHPEAPIVADLGAEIGGQRHNLYTVRCHEALLGLDRGAVLADFRRAGARRVVWELGSGWGGFAYRFKTLFPNTTYIITDTPDRLLPTALYLAHVLPDARLAFYGDEPSADGRPVDFLFVPRSAVGDLRPDHVDVAVSLGSFPSTPLEEVESSVRRAYELDARYFYAVWSDSAESRAAAAVVARWYWPHEIPVLPSKARPWLRKQFPSIDHGRVDSRHVLAWKRILV